MFLSRNNHRIWLYLAKRQLSKFSHTSVFMQTGLKIRELPMVVQKVNDVLKIEELNQVSKSDPSDVSPTTNNTITLPSQQDREIMEGFNRIVTVTGLFKVLEAIPAQEVTPTVAVHCLKRIIYLNNNLARRNNFEIDVSISFTNNHKVDSLYRRKISNFTSIGKFLSLTILLLSRVTMKFILSNDY